MRISVRRGIKLVLGVALIAMVCLTGQYREWKRQMEEHLIHDRFCIEAFKLSDGVIKEKMHYTRYNYSSYAQVLKGQDLNRFRGYGMNEKCQIFFNGLDRHQPEWQLDLMEDPTYEKNAVNKAGFFKLETEKVMRKMLDAKSPEPKVMAKSDNVTINNLFKSRVEGTIQTETKMADTTTLLRIFGQCFLNNPDYSVKGDTNETLSRYSRKLFPYLTGNMPTFHAPDGSVYQNGFPIFENLQFQNKTHEYDGVSIFKFIKEKSNGRGIVISATNRYSKDLVKLIRVLRALNNELPIQVVYKGDLSERSRNRIREAATQNMVPDIDDNVKPNGKPDSEPERFHKYSNKFGARFPQQNIWFVDILNTVHKTNKYTFRGFQNKLLAYVFNSFEETLILDADTVPLVPPTTFFDLEEFKASSTLFFKDRSLRDTNKYIETNFFGKLMPTSEHSIDAMFGVEPVTNYTLSNTYFGGYTHFQEAGVVAINRKEHFTGVLMTMLLASWSEPIESSVWGDKELYWLGLSLSGDENYQFNKYSAASIGEVTSNNELKQYPHSRANELCSSHPGHVSKNGTLLWMNSGFSYCKKNTYYRDRDVFPYSKIDIEVLSDLYEHPLRITHAIVPPDLPLIRETQDFNSALKEESIRAHWESQPKDWDELGGNLDDKLKKLENQIPVKGWIKSPSCSSYHYCAYDLVTSFWKDGPERKGDFITFSEESASFYDFLGSIWLTGETKQMRQS